MLRKLGEKFTAIFLRIMPDSYVFALALTLIAGLVALIWMKSSPLEIIVAWYDGFFDLLSFGMQIVLIIITGFSIALSPAINKGIDKLSVYVNKPGQVYFFVTLVGALLCLVSFGWVVVTSVLARQLALRVKGLNYPYLVACVYVSMGSWVLGLSSSIPLLLNTDKNYLIEAGVLNTVIPTSYTLGSILNIAMIITFVVVAPLLMYVLSPKDASLQQIDDLKDETTTSSNLSIKEEAQGLKLPFKALSDTLNNSFVLQLVIAMMGLSYVIYHFSSNGFELNFNIMIFIFLMTGLLLHKTPMRFVIAMKRSSSNVSGILFQYPFYAGIMGIMLYTGLGKEFALLMASVATENTYPFFAFVAGGFVNFAIPSAGGEFAVIGPSIIEAVKEIGAGISGANTTEMIARASLSIAYGESLSNFMQPFYLLLVFPIMGAGVKLQPRDVIGYLFIPLVIFFILQVLLVTYMPL